MAKLSALVLAAGLGTRMRSARPKAMHVLCGRPMVAYAIDAVVGAGADRVVVVVPRGADELQKRLHDLDGADGFRLIEQHAPRGSADAVRAGLDAFAEADLSGDDDDDDVLVVPGDLPLLRAATLQALVAHHRRTGAAGTILTSTNVGEPTGIVRRDSPGRIIGIDEVRVRSDGGEGEALSGAYCFRRSLVGPALRLITPLRSNGRYRLQGVVEVLADTGHTVEALPVPEEVEAMGVNDRVEMAEVEAALRDRTNRHWLARGVTMLDPCRTYLDTTVELGIDVTLFPGTMLQGSTVVGAGAEIGPDTQLVDCAVGAGARVVKTMGRDAEVGPDAQVGPFAVLEPGAQVLARMVTGAFYTADSTERTDTDAPPATGG